MRSVRPGIPGRRQQIPRTFITTSTPAWEAWASLSMSFRSVMEFSFRKIYPRSPLAISRSMSWMHRSRS